MSKVKVASDDEMDDLDDLLSLSGDGINTPLIKNTDVDGLKEAANDIKNHKPKKPLKVGVVDDEDTTAKKAKAKQDAIDAKKALQEKKKADKINAPARENKGEWVRFKNNAGKEIVGPGVLYYVCRMNGKLYYKEASQVEILENPNIEVPFPKRDTLED